MLIHAWDAPHQRRQDLTMRTSARDIQAGRVRAAASVFVIVLSIGVAWVNTDVAKYCWLLLAVVPQVADRWSGRLLGYTVTTTGLINGALQLEEPPAADPVGAPVKWCDVAVERDGHLQDQ
jgi:hypothetical protein